MSERSLDKQDGCVCWEMLCMAFSEPCTVRLLLYDLCTVRLLLHSNKRARCNKCVEIFSTKLINKPISGCVRMACDSLLTTSLLHVVIRFVAS